jgi:hypothetical protein
VDLGKFSSVMKFCDKFDEDGGRVDLVVMNAGIESHIYDVTSDGWESRYVFPFYCHESVFMLLHSVSIQVNHLSTALVSFLLLPHLLRTAKASSTTPRLVIVSSDVHYLTQIPKREQDSPKILEKLNDREYCTPSCVLPALMIPIQLLLLLTHHITPQRDGKSISCLQTSQRIFHPWIQHTPPFDGVGHSKHRQSRILSHQPRPVTYAFIRAEDSGLDP